MKTKHIVVAIVIALAVLVVSANAQFIPQPRPRIPAPPTLLCERAAKWADTQPIFAWDYTVLSATLHRDSEGREITTCTYVTERKPSF